jgi:hypothetical protein
MLLIHGEKSDLSTNMDYVIQIHVKIDRDTYSPCIDVLILEGSNCYWKTLGIYSTMEECRNVFQQFREAIRFTETNPMASKYPALFH